MSHPAAIAHFRFEVAMEPCPLESGFDCGPHYLIFRGQVEIPRYVHPRSWVRYAIKGSERDLNLPSYHKLVIIITKSVD